MWQTILLVFDFEIEFIKKDSNSLTDFLSCEFLQGKWALKCTNLQKLQKPLMFFAFGPKFGPTARKTQFSKPKQIPSYWKSAFKPIQTNLCSKNCFKQSKPIVCGQGPYYEGTGSWTLSNFKLWNQIFQKSFPKENFSFKTIWIIK